MYNKQTYYRFISACMVKYDKDIGMKVPVHALTRYTIAHLITPSHRFYSELILLSLDIAGSIWMNALVYDTVQSLSDHKFILTRHCSESNGTSATRSAR